MINLTDKTILITGGTGSYGQALVEGVLRECADLKALMVFSRDEYKQHEMRQRFPNAQFPALKFMLGDVRDAEAVRQATMGTDVIIHAAALKQNITGEQFPDEFIKTNVEGTRNVVMAATSNNVKQVLAISTDKAVYPTTLYGASKLCAEKLMLAANETTHNPTRFSVLRLGNLFGSRGSISSNIEEKLSAKEVYITDPAMSRFSLTMEESTGHTFKVLEAMRGGEIFVPKMPTYQLGDLIHAWDNKLKIIPTGPRLTEKMHEIALSSEESRYTVDWEDLFVMVNAQAKNYDFWQAKGTPVPLGFEYNSSNAARLSIDELTKLIHL